MRFSRFQKFLSFLILSSFFCLIIFGLYFSINSDVETKNEVSKLHEPTILSSETSPSTNDGRKILPLIENETKLSSDIEGLFPIPNTNVHLFYYPWYGNPAMDEKYLHWNHRYIKHWKVQDAGRWPTGRHQPPGDIGANFYPRLGPYSSKDPKILNNHMQQIRSSGAGVLAVSWYPSGMADDEGEDSDSTFQLILEHANKYDLKVCVHIEPYMNRSSISLKQNIKYIIDKYGDHPALYRHRHKSGKMLPLYYLYDSYLVSNEQWKSLLHPDSLGTVRGTRLDGIFIGLIVERSHANSLATSGFDGLYTYFGSTKFTFGSNILNWGYLATFCKAHDMLFIPSVGPGYIDVRVRPWNSENTKGREDGKYYCRNFDAAIQSNADIISVTSFNEWHEGTQIEEAEPMTFGDFKYMDYKPHEANYYLVLTRNWILKFKRHQKLSGRSQIYVKT